MSTTTSTNETCPAELPNWCAQRHWAIFWIIIVCSVASVAGRIITIQNHSADGDPAFFSANDRSRWSTIRALGDSGTYEIDSVIARRSEEELADLFAKQKATGDTNEYYKISWNTIDKVRHLGEDGQPHYYSSKPTLLPTILSAGYIAINRATGLTMEQNSVPIIRTLLLILNAGGWLAFMFFLAKTINSVPVRDWSRYYVLACGGFGTFLTTFAVVLNNHLPAAVAVMAGRLPAHANLAKTKQQLVFLCSLWIVRRNRVRKRTAGGEFFGSRVGDLCLKIGFENRAGFCACSLADRCGFTRH